MLKTIAFGALLLIGCTSRSGNREHLSPMAWTSAEWRDRCHDVRTSYNSDHDLTDETLTLVPGDPRWLDFVYWSIDNKVAEHQVEAYGGTGWSGPKGGIVFHWAPGSHWERDTLASFGFTVGHTIGEHRWLDTMFPDFFEKYGGVYGVNVKDRLSEIDPASPKPWVEFLEYGGGAKSPLYRYLFHREAVVDPSARKIELVAGQGIAFEYSFERYYHELREVLTDCRAIDFFQMYDGLGAGFAARGNWAHQNPPSAVVARTGYVGETGPQPGVAEATRYNPAPPAVEVPDDLPEADSMRRGKQVYLGQCAMCHGVRGDGAGFLAAGFDVKPRDFRQGTFKFRSTATGELPTIDDVEKTVRVGVSGTSMPAWGQFLTADQIHDVSRYLVVFSPTFTTAWRTRAAPQPLALAHAPEDLSRLAPRGAEVAKQLQCSQCHGERGKGDGPAAATLKDDWGNAIKPADLTYAWSFKNGHKPEDLYRSVMGGLNGTPMPSYATSLLRAEDAWALVAWISSLSPSVRPSLHLANFARERARIGTSGHVEPPNVAEGGPR
jgi:mono/diheme cytochrome c family protein